MPIDREIVVAGYVQLLKREPESEEAIRQHAQGSKSVADFLRALVRSSEYRSLHGGMDAISDAYWSPTQAVQVAVPDDVLAKLMARVQGQWKKLGEEDPYWSVLTSERYRQKNLNAATLNEFLEGGAASANLLEHFESHTETKLARGSCFELGCGVGRITHWLAKKFDEVIAADISPGNLALCKSNLESRGIRNVKYLLIDDLSQYDSIPEFDVFFSLIVLQHNTPPIQRLILQKVFDKIKPGGGCLFQTPAFISNYSFDALAYLQSPGQVLEMHVLPMRVILKEMAQHGLTPLNVLTDGWTGVTGSYTYFASREPSPEHGRS